MPEEIIVPFSSALKTSPVATACRSTPLMASLGAIQRHGLYARYKANIAAQTLSAIESAVAAMWLPIDVGLAHYAAVEALNLPVQQQLEIGGEVVLKIQQTLFGTVIRAARASGTLSAWTVLARFGFIYDRSFLGGGAQVTQVGPKDARFDVVGLPLARVIYFRNAYRGFIRAGTELFTSRVFVTDLTRPAAKDHLVFRVAWA